MKKTFTKFFIIILNLYSMSIYSENLTQDKDKIVLPAANSMTFAIIKPDAVESKKAGQIITAIELNGFEIVRIEKRQLTVEEAKEFYIEHKGKSFYGSLVETMTSGDVYLLALRIEGPDAVKKWRTLIGSTNPAVAEFGTIRKMFAKSGSENAVHGSDSDASAQRELKFFFEDLLPKKIK
jgi:nucleoside-diphosphate kinase